MVDDSSWTINVLYCEEAVLNESKKKHNWMKGFVIGKPTPEIEKVRYESIQKMQDHKNKLIKNGK